MQKNTAGKWVVFAFDRTDNTAKTGDAANITANMRIDGGAANAVDDVNPTELEDGFYIFDITATEANGDNLLLTPVSGTANIQVVGCPPSVWTRPPNFEVLGIESGGAITSLNGHTVQTGDSFARIGVAGAGLTNIDLPNQTMNITGNLSGSVGSVTGAVGSVTGAVGSVTGAVGSVAGNVDGSVASVVGHTAQTGDSFARIGVTGSGLTSLAQAAVATEARLAELDAANLPADVDALTTAVAALNDISVADLLTTQMTESYNADGAAPTLAQALHLIIAYLMERSVSGTTVTAKKLDGATSAATFTLDSATVPTNVTRVS